MSVNFNSFLNVYLIVISVLFISVLTLNWMLKFPPQQIKVHLVNKLKYIF